MAYFDPSVSSPRAAQVGLPNLTGALVCLGEGNSRNQQQTDLSNWGPRFGFAYSIGDKTVIRGGYGIFYVPRDIQGLSRGSIEAFRDTPFVGTIDDVTPANTLQNPFPQGFLLPGNFRNPLANEGAQIQAPIHQHQQGYAQTFSFGIQRQIQNDLVLSVNYWGNKGTRLYAGAWELNQLPNEYLSLGQALNDQVPNPFYGFIESGPISGQRISRRQSLLPYPQYTSVQRQKVMAGSAIYHAATVSVEKKTARGLALSASYSRSTISVRPSTITTGGSTAH